MGRMSDEDRKLKDAIVEFYREQINTRYQLANVRRFDQFDDIPDDQMKALRKYFMDHIYPPTADRERLDDAISRMGDVIKSPRRLRPLVTAVLSSMWKMGTSLPTAISAGTSTLDAYLEARKLEAIMLKAAKKRGISSEDSGDYDKMISIMADIPEKEVLRLIKNILKLFHALSKTKMLKTAVEFLTKCAEIMRGKPELYKSSEVEGIELGCEMVQGGLDLFLGVKPKLFPRIIEGIEKIELDWYNAIRDEAAKV